jgi:two-component system sensor kinase FixL
MIMQRKESAELVKEVRALRERLSQKDREIENLKIDNLFLGTLFDGISEEILVLDADHNIKDANKAFLKQYGVKKSQVVGKKCYKIKRRSNTPCSSGDIPCPLDAAIKTGKTIDLPHFDWQDGDKTKELHLIMYPIRPRGRKPEYFMEIGRDVSESRRLIGQLRASEKRFRAILDTATDAILGLDSRHKIILFNNAARRIFGYPSEEVLGADLSLLIPPKSGVNKRYLTQFFNRKESDLVGKTVSLVGVRKDGEEFPIELSLSLLVTDDGMTFTAFIRDLTERRLLEKKLLQSERLAAVGQAAAHVAHEIRNPLMIIGAFSNHIRQHLKDEKDLQKSDLILDEVRRLEALAANLGDFTKEYRLVKRTSDINTVLQDVLEIMAGICSLEKYRFEKYLSKEVTEIQCDPDKLKQVFINIINNGLQAMSDGGAISVSTHKVPGGIQIRIADEGPGIREDHLEHLFEPFFTTREGGSGLGLPISYKIVHAHQGDIWAESNPLKGASFIIQLPTS